MCSDGPRMESPLVGFSFAGGVDQADAGLHLEERAFLGHVNLRGDLGDARFGAGVRATLGFDVPAATNTFVMQDGMAAVWAGPDEWLILTPPGGETKLIEGLRGAIDVLHAAVTDVTGGQTVFRLSGSRVREVLAKGCTLDLHLRAFGTGRCAQTSIAHAAVTVLQIDDSPCFDVIVRRSFARYLALWIEDAASEFGLSVA